jgi:hypothetical protein
MTSRRLISKILGPPAVLFLILVTSYLAYRLVTGTFDEVRMKSEANLAIESFHDRFNRDDLSSACENDEYAWREPLLDCMSQLKEVKSRFGKFKMLQTAEFQVVSEPRYVRIEAVSIFERGELSERFLTRPGLGVVNYQALATQNGR